MNTKYKLSAVIFDMDGLLLDSEKIALASFRETCAHFGLGDLTPVFMQCVGTNQASCVQVLKKELQGKTDYLAFERLWNEKYSLATVSAIPLKDGVIELLNEIEKWGLRTAVATSTVTLKARQKLEKSGILHRFEFIVGGDQVEKSKPCPDIYLKAAALLGMVPEQCLVLEDSENGVRAAFSAGMKVIQIPDLVEPTPELRALGHTILSSLRDVPAWCAQFRTG